MADRSDTEGTRQIRCASPESKILLLSMHDRDTVRELAKAMGGDAFLTKGCGREELRKTIASVLSSAAAVPRANDLQAAG